MNSAHTNNVSSGSRTKKGTGRSGKGTIIEICGIVAALIIFWFTTNLDPILLYGVYDGTDNSTIVVKIRNDYFGPATNVYLTIVPGNNLNITDVEIKRSSAGVLIENQTDAFVEFEYQNISSYRIYFIPNFLQNDSVNFTLTFKSQNVAAENIAVIGSSDQERFFLQDAVEPVPRTQKFIVANIVSTIVTVIAFVSLLALWTRSTKFRNAFNRFWSFKRKSQGASERNTTLDDFPAN